jgi:hypothetical protein
MGEETVRDGQGADLIRRQTLDLWEERFQRLFKAEAESRHAYNGILKRFSHLLAGSRIKESIRELRKEESRHIEIAQKLLEIVREERRG